MTDATAAVHDVEIVNVGFKSADGKSQVKGVIWKPTDAGAGASAGADLPAPKAIIQLVHGMCEHIARYEDFARYLVSQGYVVCGHDHVGHGKSVDSHDEWGILPFEGGCKVLVEDTHEMHKLVAARYPRQTPYVLFGHSMGSFVVRAYATTYSDGIDGLIVCGTGHNPKIVCQLGGFLAKRNCKSKGPDYFSATLQGMAEGAYSKAIANARTPLDWLSYNEENVDRYIADDACGFPFKVSGYATLMDLTAYVADKANITPIRKDLPVFFIAGCEDPVGKNGEGVRQVYEMFRAAGIADVECKLYDKMRHEILNEDDHQIVYDDVVAWIEQHVGKRS